jgi:hypothetical protein
MEAAIEQLPDITYLCELTQHLLFIQKFLKIYSLKNMNIKKVLG